MSIAERGRAGSGEPVPIAGQTTEVAPPGLLLRLVRDQRLAFVIIGSINTVVGFAIFVGCSQTLGHFVDHRFGEATGTFATIGASHVLGVLFAFVMHRRFVFRVRGHVLRDLVRFESVYLTALAVNAVVLPALIGFGVGRIPAQAIIVISATLLSYFGHRNFTFRRSAALQPDSACSRKIAGA